jgi:hypothetical protein
MFSREIGGMFLQNIIILSAKSALLLVMESTGAIWAVQAILFIAIMSAKIVKVLM